LNRLSGRAMIATARSSVKAERAAPARQSGGLLSMYACPPTEELTLDEFEGFAVDRLHVLRVIENLKAKGVRPKELEQQLAPVLAEYLPLRGRAELAAEDARKDAVSHFLLRLAYSRSEDLRRWFLEKECALFRIRLERLGARDLGDFLAAHDLRFREVSDEAKAARAGPLRACLQLAHHEAGALDQLTFYEIDFTEALDLVAMRHVYLERGVAFVPQQRLHSIIVSRFRAALSKSLVQAAASFAMVAGDPRLAPLLKNVEKHDITATAEFDDGDASGITPEQIDALAARSMPLCMRGLHGALRREHKLKHWGRQQYGLFLKAAGLSMEDSLRFFQASFTKVMTPEAFSKEYAYAIRHRYGKEGKRTDYAPYGCFKIIMDFAPGPGEHHGCPYRHHDADHLAALVGTMALAPTETAAILGHVKKKNYQLACQRHFEATHPKAPDHTLDMNGVGNHPNAWFKASRTYHTSATPDPAAGVVQPTTPTFAARSSEPTE